MQSDNKRICLQKWWITIRMCMSAAVGVNQPHKFTIKTRIYHEDVEPFLLLKNIWLIWKFVHSCPEKVNAVMGEGKDAWQDPAHRERDYRICYEQSWVEEQVLCNVLTKKLLPHLCIFVAHCVWVGLFYCQYWFSVVCILGVIFEEFPLRDKTLSLLLWFNKK